MADIVTYRWQVLHDGHSDLELEDFTGVSRPGKDWRLPCNGKKGGTIQSKSTRTNWYHPILWTLIDTSTAGLPPES
jgi:hypothetical protein